jgi:pSer/pThr/pTyr-binding forkhead associated (FHA) protein
MMMHRAFSAGTDTQEMWGLLQMNCLALADQKHAAKPTSPTPQADEPRPVEAPKRPQRPISTSVVSSGMGRVQTGPVRPKLAEEIVEKAPARYCLALQGGYHRIALVESGQILLGRFDPATIANPDVDLSYDDRKNRVISRRHARIIGHEGFHLIEDMGSTNGTVVNGEKLRIGQKVILQQGDRVTLGDHEFSYEPVPEVRRPSSEFAKAYLWGTFTGRRFPLPSWGEVLVGRSDPVVGFTPDIDLGGEEVVAQVVARRHVKISARNSRHYVEDLGSANGTKLNGTPIGIGERGLLEPGDHLWLGGCVLAYDVES